MDIKVIEPIRKPLKEFALVNDFNIYYHKHKEEMDAETTHVLNKKYHINGYRITKIKGVLCLKKDSKNPHSINNRGAKTSCVSESEVNGVARDIVMSPRPDGSLMPSPSGVELEEGSKIPQLELRIQRIEETLNQLIDLLNLNK